MRTFLHFFLLIGGFTLVTPVIAKLPDLPEEQAGRCRALGDVSASSGYGKNPNWQPIARTYAEKKAENLGATHVSSIQFIAGGSFNGEARLKAYACP
ncbi:MAG: hypothetical protein RLZ25_116 [Pseudomonadota bacterium]|jgi:hypothetical protein